jgi:hypothetical protein
MFTMYDSVSLDQIPAGPHAVASYINGKYQNYAEAMREFPHARHLGISVQHGIAAECYDIENGDYKPADAPYLLKTAEEKGMWRPCFYANLSTMPAVKEALKGTPRNSVRLWVADWDDTPIIPAGYDAKQFATGALGRNLDESICASDFFRPLTKEITVPAPEPVKVPIDLHVTYDPGTDKWEIKS